MGGGVGNSSVQEPGPNATANWYYYNPTTLQSGFSEFSRKWGLRKLEDNWRISDKRNINSGVANNYDGEGGEVTGNDSVAAGLTNHDRAYYLLELPFTEEQQAEANHQISDALYNVGFIYLDRLSDYPRSIDAYEKLDTRYPGNDHELPAWYALYKMYNDERNTEKADYYKNQILSKYPESSYANFILDPNYYVKLEEDARQASDLYTRTYDAYQQGQYFRVRMNADRALQLYANDTALAPRFALLDAVARGRLETVDSMAYALVRVINDYPNSSVKNYATTLLQNINDEYHLGIEMKGIVGESGDKNAPEVKSPYTYEPLAKHFVIVVFNSMKVRTEPLKVRITDFNKKEHRFKELEMKNLMISNDLMVVSLSSFPNEQEAKEYITSMFITDYVFGGIDKADYAVLPISAGNFSVFLQEKKVDDYKTFLEENSK